jgi:hypothetical protein
MPYRCAWSGAGRYPECGRVRRWRLRPRFAVSQITACNGNGNGNGKSAANTSPHFRNRLVCSRSANTGHYPGAAGGQIDGTLAIMSCAPERRIPRVRCAQGQRNGNRAAKGQPISSRFAVTAIKIQSCSVRLVAHTSCALRAGQRNGNRAAKGKAQRQNQPPSGAGQHQRQGKDQPPCWFRVWRWRVRAPAPAPARVPAYTRARTVAGALAGAQMRQRQRLRTRRPAVPFAADLSQRRPAVAVAVRIRLQCRANLETARRAKKDKMGP